MTGCNAAPNRSAPSRSAHGRSAPNRSAPSRSAPSRSAHGRCSLAIVAAALALGALAGCASPARTTALVAPLTAQTIVTETHPLFRQVRVGSVSGGRRTGLLDAPQVSSVSMLQAIDTSLDLTLLRAETPTGRDAPGAFRLDATLEALDQPTQLLDLSVTATATYFLRRASDGVLLYQDRITTRSVAGVQHTIIRSERYRLATERAVQGNIAEFLNRLITQARRTPEQFR